jgi:hypothetical protein
MNLEQLLLDDDVQAIARELWEGFPGIVFTSGRRTLQDQAHAMAENVVLNRRWIAQTYARSLASVDCQSWIDQTPEATTTEDIAAGLLRCLNLLSKQALDKLSKHLIGRAFDVQPMAYPDGLAVKAWLKAKAAQVGGKFLEREGGLLRWHWEAA